MFQILRASQLVVRVYQDDTAAATAIFQVEGLRQEAEKVADQINWDRELAEDR